MEFVLVLGGAFPMGSDSGEDDERPARSVYVSTFYMARHELDNARFELFDPDHASRRSRHSPGDAFPAVNVRWTEAAAYCRWLSVRTGRAVRLPTEAEWEKAARGDDGRVFPWGDEPPAEGGIFRANLGQGEDRSAWGSDGYRGCSPVTAFGEFASPSGCLNMAGNVWEWCADRYSATSYMRAERRNPVGPSAGDERVLRGGSWSSDADVLRAANRSRGSELLRDVNIGFRCVLETP